MGPPQDTLRMAAGASLSAFVCALVDLCRSVARCASGALIGGALGLASGGPLGHLRSVAGACMWIAGAPMVWCGPKQKAGQSTREGETGRTITGPCNPASTFGAHPPPRTTTMAETLGCAEDVPACAPEGDRARACRDHHAPLRDSRARAGTPRGETPARRGAICHSAKFRQN